MPVDLSDNKIFDVWNCYPATASGVTAAATSVLDRYNDRCKGVDSPVQYNLNFWTYYFDDANENENVECNNYHLRYEYRRLDF